MTQFKIQASGKTIKLLSDTIYSNKGLAVVRELGCNAYDAHVMVGRENDPFEVHIPDAADKTFRIRDYGPGLSPEDMHSIYSTYGHSTKTEDERTTGALGIGSKSPF